MYVYALSWRFQSLLTCCQRTLSLCSTRDSCLHRGCGSNCMAHSAAPTWDHAHFYHGTYEKANKALLKEKLRTRRRLDVNKEEARGAYEARQLLDIILDTNV